MAMTTRDYTFETEFVSLFRKHEYRLYTMAIVFTKSDQFAKDIVQATFLKLWDKRDSLLYVDNIESWLYRQAENKILHFLEKAASFSSIRDAIWISMQKPNFNDVDTAVPVNFNLLIENAIQHLPPQRQDIYTSCQGNFVTYNYIKKNIDGRDQRSDNNSWVGKATRWIKSLV